MSLRLRLTLLSTLVSAGMSILFGAIAFFTVQHLLYSSIDQNLEKQAGANIVYILMGSSGGGLDSSRLGSNTSLSSVFFTVYRPDGSFVRVDRQIPFSDALFTRALDGETIKDFSTLSDGIRVRLLIQPITIQNEILGVHLSATPLQMVDELLKELRNFLIIAGAVLLLAAAGGSFLLTRRALNEVEKVTLKAHQIAISGDLSQRIREPGTQDEVGNLVSTFNQMLERLQAGFESQRRFIADSSHELRTPLTVIRSNINLLQRTSNPEVRRELFTVTEAEVSRLNRMVNDLLYMAQMQAGYKVKPALRPVELDSLLLEIFARARAMAATKDQRIVLAHEDIATTLGDSDQLQHLFLNLVDNAVKYTPTGGTVSLGLWNDGDWARIDVRDTGPGIPATQVPHIFERFFRTPEARDTERSGSGLGLAIVKSIADAHGARLQVLGMPGGGTTFRVRLPIYKAVPPQPPPPPQPENGNANSNGKIITRVRSKVLVNKD
jgi:signal transduction histidine kinase